MRLPETKEVSVVVDSYIGINERPEKREKDERRVNERINQAQKMGRWVSQTRNLSLLTCKKVLGSLITDHKSFKLVKANETLTTMIPTMELRNNETRTRNTVLLTRLRVYHSYYTQNDVCLVSFLILLFI